MGQFRLEMRPSGLTISKPRCKLESEDIFDLGEKTVGKCDNPKCQVSLFFVE